MNHLSNNRSSIICIIQLTNYRRTISLLLLIFVCNNASSQNLVPNPSFEEYTSCPSGGGQLSSAAPWEALPNNDVEYFNSCSTHPDYSVPYQGGYNYQQAHSGDAFAGSILYYIPGFNTREYIQCQLSATLSANRTFYAEFWVNRAGGAFGGKYAINNISLSFRSAYTDPAFYTGTLHYSPDIITYTNPIIDDTLDWVRINGVYVANGTENYIVIGNQSNDQFTDTLNVQDGAEPAAVYFIDDVLVEEILSPRWDYRDTTIYYGESVLIGPCLTGLDIDWYTAGMEFISNAPGIVVTPPTSRNYIAEETFNGSQSTHIVHVTVIGGVGIDENDMDQLVVYPNPSQGEIQFSGKGLTGAYEMEITDLNGKKLLAENRIFSDEAQMLDTHLQNGIYILTIKNPATGRQHQRRIVIQNNR